MGRLVLVEDHRLFRECLRERLGRERDLKVIGEAEDARGALRLVERDPPDLVLIDIGLPGTNGIAVVRELVRRNAEQKTMLLTMHTSPEYVADGLRAGARGYAIKSQTTDEVIAGVRAVLSGGSYLSPQLDRAAVDRLLARSHGASPAGAPGPVGRLSPREREIFDMLARAFTNDDVAKELSISVRTVETHRQHIFSKLRVHSLAELMRFAARHHLVSDLDQAAGAKHSAT
jgi:DNA-binding NarL/FixJ family response regulator